MPKFRGLPAGVHRARPKTNMQRGRAAASGAAISEAKAQEQDSGCAATPPSRRIRFIVRGCRSLVEFGAVTRTRCWVSLIGKATGCTGESKGSNPFTQLQAVALLVTQTKSVGSLAEATPFVTGCTFDAGLTQTVKEEARDPYTSRHNCAVSC